MLTPQSYHLKERQIGIQHVVEIDLRRGPSKILVQADGLVRRDAGVDALVTVLARVELPGHELDAHDGEDQPEYEAHEEYVEDGGDGLDQGIHYHLGIAKSDVRLVLRHVFVSTTAKYYLTD